MPPETIKAWKTLGIDTVEQAAEIGVIEVISESFKRLELQEDSLETNVEMANAETKVEMANAETNVEMANGDSLAMEGPTTEEEKNRVGPKPTPNTQPKKSQGGYLREAKKKCMQCQDEIKNCSDMILER